MIRLTIETVVNTPANKKISFYHFEKLSMSALILDPYCTTLLTLVAIDNHSK